MTYQEPPYSGFTPPVQTPGRPNIVWSNEAVAANSSSMQVCLHRNEHFPTVMSAQIQFAADPGAFQVDLQTADVDDDTLYVTKASINSGLNASFVGRIEATDIVARFVRLRMVTKTNAVNVTATLF